MLSLLSAPAAYIEDIFNTLFSLIKFFHDNLSCNSDLAQNVKFYSHKSFFQLMGGVDMRSGYVQYVPVISIISADVPCRYYVYIYIYIYKQGPIFIYRVILATSTQKGTGF